MNGTNAGTDRETSWAIWITGLPGSGKSALARAAAETLGERGVPVTVLELDAIRKIVTPDSTCRDQEREAVYRVLAFMATALVEAGVPVIIDATAHRRRWRELARDLIPRFAEVQLEGARATVPGVDREYEPALEPELVIDTTAEGIAAGAEKIAALAERLAGESSPPARAQGGWALWITGRPGSGKTTIARRVASALAARSVRVSIVEAAVLRRLVQPLAVEGLDELVNRAVVCLARLLVEAGIPVIVDATAHRRRWRELARTLIPRFAEIQLACPPEICATRERAERWRLGGWGRADSESCAGMDIDVIFDYEPALCPDLTIYTDVEDSVTAAENVLFVAERFRRTALERQEGRP